MTGNELILATFFLKREKNDIVKSKKQGISTMADGTSFISFKKSGSTLATLPSENDGDLTHPSLDTLDTLMDMKSETTEPLSVFALLGLFRNKNI